jgi:cytochrome c oxidase cbb3-type subunit 4
METYSLLREFADSWMLLTLFIFFVAMVLWVFRPGSRATHVETASIPFRHDDRPVADTKIDAPKEARQ